MGPTAATVRRLDREWQAFSPARVIRDCGMPAVLGALLGHAGTRKAAHVPITTIFADSADVLECASEYVESIAHQRPLLAAECREIGEWNYGLFDRLVRSAVECAGPTNGWRLVHEYPAVRDLAFSWPIGADDAAGSPSAEIETDSSSFDLVPHSAADRVLDESVELLLDLLRLIRSVHGRPPLIHLDHLHCIDSASARLLQRVLENHDPSACDILICACEPLGDPSLARTIRTFGVVDSLHHVDAYRDCYVNHVLTHAAPEVAAAVSLVADRGLIEVRDVATLLSRQRARQRGGRAGVRPIRHDAPACHRDVLTQFLDSLDAVDRVRVEVLALANWDPTRAQLDAAVLASGLRITRARPDRAGACGVSIGRHWRTIVRACLSDARRSAITAALTRTLAGALPEGRFHGALPHLAVESRDAELLTVRGPCMGTRSFERAGDAEGAAAFYERALSIVVEPTIRSVFYARLAMIDGARRRLAAMDERFASALRLESRPFAAAVLCHEYAGALCRYARAFTAARQILEQGRAIAQGIRDRDERLYADARLNNGEALVLYREGRWSEAADRLRAALDMLDAIQPAHNSLKAYAAVILRNCAHLDTLNSDVSALLGHHRRAVEIGRATGRLEEALWSLIAIGSAQLALGDHVGARSDFDEALGAFSSSQSPTRALAVIVRECMKWRHPAMAMHYTGVTAAYYRRRRLPVQAARVWLRQAAAFEHASLTEEAGQCRALAAETARTLARRLRRDAGSSRLGGSRAGG